MKKVLFSLLSVMLISCSSTQKTTSNSTVLYEVLTQQSNGGASIRFFEILSESNEIAMLQHDEKLKNKIQLDDIQNSNFIILNMGEKSTGGYKIGIETVVETDKNIIVTVKEISPEADEMVSQAITTPYCIVKINSKKEIIIQN